MYNVFDTFHCLYGLLCLLSTRHDMGHGQLRANKLDLGHDGGKCLLKTSPEMSESGSP